MSDTKIDLTITDLSPADAKVILAYLDGDSPAMAAKGEAPKKTKKKATNKKPEEKPAAPPIEVVDKTEDDDWDDDGNEDATPNNKYAAIRKWRELATVLVADGYDTEEGLLEKCKELRGTVPALEKIPDDNLVTRCGRAIELLGA